MVVLQRVLALVVGAGLLLSGCKQQEQSARRDEPRQAPAATPSTRLAAPPSAPPPSSQTFEPGDAARGKQLVAQFECNRCHEGTGLAAPALAQDCVRCHEQIATGAFKASPAKLAQWKPHVMAYRDVPSLTALGRLRPAWVMGYLRSPHDLRPSLTQNMPRLELSEEQARDITTYLATSGAVAGEAVAPEPAQIARGRELMQQRACTTCHHMSGTDLPGPPRVEPAPRTLGLAPDLRFARARMEPEVLRQWLLDPTRIKHDSAMPNLGLSADDARDLAAFLSFSELGAAPVAAQPARLPVLSRRVGFDEVNERVFAVTCRHCHTNPDSAGGDGGPGNTGGFGFRPRKIDFSSYQGIQSGGIDARGQRVSLFAPTADGVPRLVAALLARHREEAGQATPGVRGMPLGLPPVSPELVQLVESWVEQGRPL